MSSGTYHRRWASVGADGAGSAAVKRGEIITQTIAPRTYGTSWNSVRWNKPSENGSGIIAGGHWSRSFPFFEPVTRDYGTNSSYSMSPTGRFSSQPISKTSTEFKNSGPSMRDRSIRFGDSMLSLMNDKTASRASPRLPWLSDTLINRRSTAYNKFTRNPRESVFTSSSRWTPSSSPAVRSLQLNARSTVPSSSLATLASLPDRSFLSNNSQTFNRAERPWRRRLVDAARLRNVHRDEFGGAINSALATIRTGRGSVSSGQRSINNNGDDLQSSLNALKSYVDEQTASFYRQSNRLSVLESPIFTDKSSVDNSLISTKQYTPIRGIYSSRWNSGRFRECLSKSHSPVRPKQSAYATKMSKYNSLSTDMLSRPLRSSWQFNVNNICEDVKPHALDQIFCNPSLPENIRERETSRRLLSSKERTLRHHSRQYGKVTAESDSSSDNGQHGGPRKKKTRRRLRKKFNDEEKSLSTMNGKSEVVEGEKKKIIVKSDTRKDSDGEGTQMEHSQTLGNFETSVLMTFPTPYRGELELKTIPAEGDKSQPEESKKEKKEKKKEKKGLLSFIKRKKTADKYGNKTNCNNCRKESKNVTVKGKKGDKCAECKDMSKGMQKISDIDVQSADRGGEFCPDKPAFQLLSSTTLPSMSSSHKNAVMGTLANDLSEAGHEHHDDESRFDPSERLKSSKSKSPAPVPGTWSGPDYHEMNISHNKRLQRDEACNNAAVDRVIAKKCTICTIPPVTVCAIVPESRQSIEIALSCMFQPLNANNEKISFSKKYPRFIKMNKKLLEVINTTIKFDASFASRRRSIESTRDVVKANRQHRICSLRVKEPSKRLITIRESIFKRSDDRNSCRAQVIVLTSPVADVNFCHCLKRVRVTCPEHYTTSVKSLSKKASIVEQNNTTLSGSDELIASDRFLLEECVKDKREKPKQMYSQSEGPNSRESSCLLAASELMRACAVRVLEPTREVPYITAPSRSRLGSVEVETVPTSVQKIPHADSSKMINLSCGEHLLSASYHGLKSSPLVRSERSTSLTKPSFEFDAPLSPFEQSLQKQAFQLRKTLTFSDSDMQDISVMEVTMQLPVHDQNRHSSVESSSLTSNFTAAVAAAAQPRHERYAAHIPITRVDSGRQSTTSIDSYNSGIAETSNLQLDQMIDQARYKHHQHRNKFKEAIDYLDQIFEDLKKEGDQVSNTQQSCGLPAAPMHKGASNGDSDLVNVTVPSLKLQRNGTTKRAMVNGVGLEEMDSRPVYLANTNRHSLYTTKPRIIKKHSRQEKAASFEQTSEDVSTSETVVLPSHDRKLKGERLDFTRRWLAGDIKSWVAVQPKPDLILGGVEEEPDIDERSLGSCSAEVAAINSVVRKKKKARDMPDLIQNVASTAKYIRHADANQLDPSVGKCSGGHSLQQTDPIRPRPVKPQTMFAFPSGSTGNLNSSGNFSQSFCDSNVWGSNCDINGNQNQQKSIPSQQRHRDFGTITWRSTSQDPRHNVLSSVRSEEIHHSARKTGAFTPLQPPNIVAMRGSVTSLPDSSGVRPQPLHSADPIVAIDALVAELELNTDQTLVVHKRRSFPTGNEFFVRHGGKDEKAVSTQNVEQSSVQQSVRTKLEGAKYHPQKLKASFNEMASMLESVISDVTAPNELPKGRKCAQKARKNSLIFSPFETINQEKLNPSKVEAMQSIFENKQHAPVWRRSICNGNSDNVQPASNLKDDDNYYEISDFAALRKELSPVYVKPSMKQSSLTANTAFQPKRRLPLASAIAQAELVPAFPVTHPPPRPPGSANSSQTGGYYSSASSLGAPSSYASPNNHSLMPNLPGNRGPVLRKQSMSSRTASVDEEDDGFYDNIQVDEKRFSHGSELDNMSIDSHRKRPISKPIVTTNKPGSNRIGQFLRKISASKPPISAASLVSLNKVASEIMPTGPIPLMKSSSLSHYPWKKHVVQNVNATASYAAVDKRGGLGQRLKNSIFGSKKRLS